MIYAFGEKFVNSKIYKSALVANLIKITVKNLELSKSLRHKNDTK